MFVGILEGVVTAPKPKKKFNKNNEKYLDFYINYKNFDSGDNRKVNCIFYFEKNATLRLGDYLRVFGDVILESNFINANFITILNNNYKKNEYENLLKGNNNE